MTQGKKKKAAPRPRRLGRMLLRLFLLGLVVAAGAAWYVWHDYQRFTDRPLANDGVERRFEVEPGDSLQRIVARLAVQQLATGRTLYWQLLAREMDVATRLKVGEYRLQPGLTPRGLLDLLARGDVIQYRFTIVEGWSFRELRAALARNDDLAQTIAGLDDAEVMRRLDAGGEHPEGRFLPETYQFSRGTSDLDLLARAHRDMRSALARVWTERAEDVPLETPYEALILASIIEKETGRAGERREIAGVFARRLRIGMRLQTDPTVIYGIGSAYAGNITRSHLQTDTPYNTYTRAGLPPTPIAMPGLAALQAAVNPAPGDALYFVSRGDGSHQFSRTLSEHNAAVRRYQLGGR